MLFTAQTISEILLGDCTFKGASTKTFSGLQAIGEASENEISWIRPNNKETEQFFLESNAGCIICSPATYAKIKDDQTDRLYVLSESPQLAFTKLLIAYSNSEENQSLGSNSNERLIHPTAIISEKAEIGEGVRIGAYSVIDACKIGANTVIGEYVKIFSPVTIGSNCVIRENCTIGGAGFGISKDEQGNNIHMPHIGKVKIEDNVLIFPYTNIDRATLGTTVIGSHSVIDHYCHIGHNSRIGNNTIVTAQVVLAGGSQVGDRCFIGVNTLVKEKLTIGSDVTTGIGSVVVKNIPDNETWFGNPARKY